MSTGLMPARERTANAERDGNVVTVATLWFALYLFMVLGALFANQNGPVVALVLFAAVAGGWVALGGRRKKKADHIIMNSRKLFTGRHL